MISLDTSSLETLARNFSTSDVTNFLKKIELSQYVTSFAELDFSGDMLLQANAALLSKLGVESPLHQMKILRLFRRELGGMAPKYSIEHLNNFLQQNKLEKYSSIFQSCGIDGDMILEVEEKLMTSVLKEVGITSELDILKIRAKYKTFVVENP